MNRLPFALVTSLLLAAGAAPAQDDEQPAAQTRSAPAIGTTVIGERESPIGLYITPWRRAAPEEGIDRPARLLEQALEPVDPDVYDRQVRYESKLTQNRAAKADAETP